MFAHRKKKGVIFAYLTEMLQPPKNGTFYAHSKYC